MEGAEVYATSPECEGIAIWRYSEAKRRSLAHLYCGNPFLALRCGWRYIYREIAIGRYCQKIKKRYVPSRHQYLALLTVAPEYQGKGFASKLLKPVLRRLDEQHLPAYLETQNRKNLALYEHFGFAVMQEIHISQIPLPMYAMLREAR
jgi:GNAT superfamily N-acetyltransferase